MENSDPPLSPFEEELAKLQADNRRLKESRRLQEELAALQAENRCLKLRRLREELAALQAENRRLKLRRLEEELAALKLENSHLKEARHVENEHADRQPENQCFTELRRLEDELSILQMENQYLRRIQGLENELSVTEMENWRFRKMLFEDELQALEIDSCTTEWQEGLLSEKEVDSIKCADDVLIAAMPYVVAGRATFIEFSPDRLIATCGDFKHELRRPDAFDMDDWIATFESIFEAPEHYCACPVLYSTDTRLILAEPLESEAIDRLLRYAEANDSGGPIDAAA
jgi:hypothetical protein